MRGFLIAPVLAVTLLCGCIRIEQVLTLTSMGGGVFEVNYSLGEQTVEQLNGMRKMREDMDAAGGEHTEWTLGQRYMWLLLDPVEEQLRMELVKYARYGVEIEKLKVESRGAARHVQLRLTFSSLAELAKSDLFKQYGFSMLRNSAGDYVMARTPPKVADLGGVKYSDADATRILSPLLSGFRATIKVNTPGAIRSTNAPKRAQRSAVWVFDFADDPYALRSLEEADLRLTFSGVGLDLPEVTGLKAAAPPGA